MRTVQIVKKTLFSLTSMVFKVSNGVAKTLKQKKTLRGMSELPLKASVIKGYGRSPFQKKKLHKVWFYPFLTHR